MRIAVTCLLLLAISGCATKEVIQEPPAPEPNEIIIEEIRGSGITAWESPRGVEVYIPDLLFEIDKHSLTGEAIGTLQVIAKIATKKIAVERPLTVSGHTDATGSEEYNFELSKRRALSVVEVLIDNGVDENRIKANWFGETVPKVQNYLSDGTYDQSAQSLNRRVEITILNGPVID